MRLEGFRCFSSHSEIFGLAVCFFKTYFIYFSVAASRRLFSDFDSLLLIDSLRDLLSNINESDSHTKICCSTFVSHQTKISQAAGQFSVLFRLAQLLVLVQA